MRTKWYQRRNNIIAGTTAVVTIGSIWGVIEPQLAFQIAATAAVLFLFNMMVSK